MPFSTIVTEIKLHHLSCFCNSELHDGDLRRHRQFKSYTTSTSGYTLNTATITAEFESSAMATSYYTLNTAISHSRIREHDGELRLHFELHRRHYRIRELHDSNLI